MNTFIFVSVNYLPGWDRGLSVTGGLGGVSLTMCDSQTSMHLAAEEKRFAFPPHPPYENCSQRFVLGLK